MEHTVFVGRKINRSVECYLYSSWIETYDQVLHQLDSFINVRWWTLTINLGDTLEPPQRSAPWTIFFAGLKFSCSDKITTMIQLVPIRTNKLQLSALVLRISNGIDTCRHDGQAVTALDCK